MNTAAKGNGKENATAALLQAQGYCVGSRRHIPGPGDLLAYMPGERSKLVEVKATPNLYQCFRRPARKELRDYANQHGLEPLVAWWKPRAREPEYLGPAEWPN